MIRFRLPCLFVLLGIWLSALTGGEAMRGKGFIGGDGVLHLSVAGEELCDFTIGLHDSSWAYAGANPAGGDPESNTRLFKIRGPNQTTITGAASFSAGADGAISAAYSFTPSAEIALNSLHVSVDFAARALAGGSWIADDKHGDIPKDFADQVGLFDATIHSLRVKGPGGELTLTFAQPTEVLIQDNRRWTPTLSLRIAANPKLKKGETASIAMQLAIPGGAALAFDRPVTMTAGDDWVPLALDLDIIPGSALDFSQMGLQDAPAGKYGRVIARADGQFAFAKDAPTARRFYGVNLCFGAQYLPHADADRLADRFVRLGYNAVRIHHYEGELMGQKAGADFVAEKLDQLDYLLAALGKRGIYVTTDLFVSRPVSWASLGGDPGKGNVRMDTYKILVPVLPAAWDDWKAFARKLLTHVNPYTSVRWADDPTLAWIAMINEGNFENFYRDIVTIPEWSAAFNAWLAKRNPDRASLAAAWNGELKDNEDPGKGTVALPKDTNNGSLRARDAVLFLALSERDMFRRMTTFLHQEVGCQALFTNTSAWTNRVTGQLARADYDYVDDHFYIDHPQFIEKDWQLPSRCGNSNPIRDGAPGGRSCNFTRLWNKPFTITEFNYSGPGRYRGVGGILTGAMGALQGWGGIWRFAYSHGANEELKPARMDYFNLATDPLNQAADRATICLFLRGDMKAASHRVAVTATLAELEKPPKTNPHLTPGWNWLGWITGVGFQVSAKPSADAAFIATFPIGWDSPAPLKGSDPYAMDREQLIASLKERGVLAAGNPTDSTKNIFRSETGELLIDAPRGVLVFDTPNTAGGYAEPGERIEAKSAGVTISDLTLGATVFVTALDRQPIASSARLLVTHLTDLQNSGAKFAESARRTLLDWGTLPHLVANGSARVRITLKNAASFRVWTLSTSGKRLSEIPAHADADADALTFTASIAGKDGAQLLYEVALP